MRNYCLIAHFFLNEMSDQISCKRSGFEGVLDVSDVPEKRSTKQIVFWTIGKVTKIVWHIVCL